MDSMDTKVDMSDSEVDHEPALRASSAGAPQEMGQQGTRSPARLISSCVPFLIRSACFLPAISLIGIILWVIWTRTALVPYWDEWETVVLVQHTQQGQLTLGELWAVHAWSHRLFLPRVLDLALIFLTRWNRQVEMTFDLAVSVGAALLLYYAVRRTVRARWLVRLLLVLLPLLVFSLGQFADWFAPFQLSFIAVFFGVALCVWAVSGDDATAHHRQVGNDNVRNDAAGAGVSGGTAYKQATGALSWGRFALLVLGATIATLSAFQGLLVWPAFIPVLALRGGRDRRQLILWLGASLDVWLIYFAGFDFRSSGLGGVSLRDIVTYATAYLGAPIGYPDALRSEVAGVAGMVLLPVAIALYFLRSGPLRRVLPWVCAALFVLLCSAATMTGRICGGAPSALSSRYQIFSALWWVALLVIAGMATEAVLHRQTSRPALLLSMAQGRRRLVMLGIEGLAALALCGSLVVASGAGLRDGLLWQDVQRQHQSAVMLAATASPTCLMIYYPRPDAVRERAAYLEGARLAIFALSVRERAQVAGDAANGGDSAASCTDPGRDLVDPGRCTTAQSSNGLLPIAAKPGE